MYVPRTAMSILLVVNDQASKISRLYNCPEVFFSNTDTKEEKRLVQCYKESHGVTRLNLVPLESLPDLLESPGLPAHL